MEEQLIKIEDLSNDELLKYAKDIFHRTMVHHVFWFKEVEREIGPEKALEVMDAVYDKSWDIQVKRLGKFFGFEVEGGIPAPLADMKKEDLLNLIAALGANWLAGDGIWFQEVEFNYDMALAKQCNDSCWAKFSPFEAWSIKRITDISGCSALEGLKKAFGLRIYAGINRQTIVDDGPDSFIFRMNDCRVQSARKRKGLDDYPCKSAGLIEYSAFAQAIDPSIKMECLGCPPDAHPEEWFCAWRFSI